jgi:hypothetical protein
MPHVRFRASRDRVLARNGAVILVLVVVFLTVGLPRWLEHDQAPDGSNAQARFAKVCRDHGGTPAAASGSATAGAGSRCTVRYGRHVYLMDAITAHGFDEDTARFQRQGCEEAARQERASHARGERRRTFVYHPPTGVCEHRP